VALDREKFFDRVQHDKRMSLGKDRGAARRVRPRIDRDLQAGARTDEGLEATVEGIGIGRGLTASPLPIPIGQTKQEQKAAHDEVSRTVP
jgi:hypothetical protein